MSTATNSLNTAQAALSSNQAKYSGSLQSALAAVETAKSRVNSSTASLEDAKTRQQASIVTAQNSLDTAQASFDEGTVKNQATLVSSKNSVDSARASLQSATANQGQSRASSADSVDGARAQVEQSTASLNTARANYESSTAMPTEFELQAAQAQVENARASASISENNLKQAALITPVDGIVASVSASVGQFISGGSVSSGTSATASTTSGTAVAGFITLTNISEPQVSAQVSEADVGRVRPGQPVTFTVSAFPGRTFTAKVARLDPIGQTISNVVNYNVVSVVDKPDVELLPSMTATVTIITEQVSNVLLSRTPRSPTGRARPLGCHRWTNPAARRAVRRPGQKPQRAWTRGAGRRRCRWKRESGAGGNQGAGGNRGAGVRAGGDRPPAATPLTAPRASAETAPRLGQAGGTAPAAETALGRLR